jgi:hypothetical protein
MAGDWIKIEHCLPGKPEVMELSRLLGIDEMAVVGHLICFWSWVDQNLSPECPAVSGTKTGLDRVAGRDGFVDAMVKVHWLTFDGQTVQVPNYEHHLSQSAKKRGLESRKKQRQRKSSRICPDTSGTNKGHQRDKIGDQRREEYLDGGPSLDVDSNRKTFQIPTFDEVEIYIDENAPEVNPEVFYRFYESKGWMVGKNKMKNWKSAVATWKAKAPKKVNRFPKGDEAERIFREQMNT